MVFDPGKFVIGEGPLPSRCFFLGRNPGIAESKIGRPFCLDEHTLTLRSDLKWVPLREIQIGDEIVTCSEHPAPGAGASGRLLHYWEVATVTRKFTRKAKCTKIFTEDAGEIIGTDDHIVFFSPVRKSAKVAHRWGPIASLRWKDISKRRQCHAIHKALDVWEEFPSRDAGWLAGFLDGEGCIFGSKLKRSKAKRLKLDIGLSQNTGPVLSRALDVIRGLGFKTREHRKCNSERYPNSTCMSARIRGKFREKMRFLGMVRPIRLLADAIRVLKSRNFYLEFGKGTQRRIVGKKEVGERNVIDISTTSGTFLANGFLVHNCGPAGNEFSMYCTRSDIQRYDHYTSNVYKFYTPEDEPPSIEQLDAHWPILARELALANPKVLITFGAEVTEYIFGRCRLDYRDMECHHGIPVYGNLPLQGDLTKDVEKWLPDDSAGVDWLTELMVKAPAEHEPLSLVIFPCIHPAAGIHQASQMAFIHHDFCELSRLLRGQLVPRGASLANLALSRAILDDASMVDEAFRELYVGAGTIMGLDTEGWPDRPFCLTFSLDGRSGFCIRASDKEAIIAFRHHLLDFIASGGKVIIHNALHDLDVLLAMGIDLPDGSYIDSMIVAYLLGVEPQGLKALSYRHLNARQKSYEDLIRPYQEKYGRLYLEAAAAVDWDACPKCGARAAVNTEHPKGGVELLAPEWLRKDGKVRAKFAGRVEVCDGGLAEAGEVVLDKAGNPRWKKEMPVGRRISRAIKDFYGGVGVSSPPASVDTGLDIPELPA